VQAAEITGGPLERPMLNARAMRRTRLYRSIIVVGTTLAGAAVVGTSGCDLYFGPDHHIISIHVDSVFAMIDASIIDASIIDASIVDAWNPIADAPNEAGDAGTRDGR
jgi:hypothetical protein